MNSRTKGYLFVVIFSFCVLLYLLLFKSPVGYESDHLDTLSHYHYNFIFLMIVFLVAAYFLTELVAYAYRILRRVGWQTHKLGEILVSQGYITQEELERALSEQKCKIGEVLVQNDRLAPTQIDHALKIQKKKYRKIGEILIELGYSTTEDIQWALDKMNKKIGSILKNKGLITDYDITCALSIKECHIEPDGNITL